MAYQIVWSSNTIEDVEAVATYISRDSSAYAAAVVQKILDVTRNLSNFPFSGRIVPELKEDTIREKFAYNYRIIYRIENDTITIASVIHGKRILDAESSDLL
jgi:plasmid stabilization system protein ParE